jgi:hypothetical protein
VGTGGQRSTHTVRRPALAARWLACGDAASLIAFTVIGLRFHRVALTVPEVLETAIPLLAAWFAIAHLTGTYRKPGAARFVLAWLVAVPLGLAIRQIVLGRPFGQGFLIFLAVGGVLTFAFLGFWRLAAALAARVLTRP